MPKRYSLTTEHKKLHAWLLELEGNCCCQYRKSAKDAAMLGITSHLVLHAHKTSMYNKVQAANVNAAKHWDAYTGAGAIIAHLFKGGLADISH